MNKDKILWTFIAILLGQAGFIYMWVQFGAREDMIIPLLVGGYAWADFCGKDL